MSEDNLKHENPEDNPKHENPEDNPKYENPKYNLEFQDQAQGVQAGNHNKIIYNYFGYREEAVYAAPVDATDDNLPCPYRGLFHFELNNAEFFFGREKFIEEIYQTTKTRNFIPVFGASGSGKSSVVFAGLVPKLLKDGHWQFTHFRPGSDPDPFYALAEALVPLYRSKDDSTDEITQAGKLAKSLNDGEPLSHVFSKIERKHSNHKVLLIADQFEEIYTLCKEEKIRRKFLDCLLASLITPTSSPSVVVLVMTMRADFLGNALAYRPFADVLRNDLKLKAMNRQELSEVIIKPADILGLEFESGLADRILDDVKDEPGNLALLEFALTELWKKRTKKQLTHQAYEKIGKVKGALADYANDKYKNLTPEEREQAQQIFIQLVHPGQGGRDTKRRANRKQLGEDNWKFITKKNGLAYNRLVVTSLDDNEQKTVEIIHEALIHNWEILQKWIETNRDFIVWQRQVRYDAEKWETSKRSQKTVLKGFSLAEAKKWKEERSTEIEQDGNTIAFIEASLELQNKEKKDKEEQKKRELEKEQEANEFLKKSILALFISSLVAVIFLLFYVQQLRIAKQEKNKAKKQEIQALVASSEALLSSNQKFDALISSLQAAKEIENIKNIDLNTKQQIIRNLLYLVYDTNQRGYLDGDNQKQDDDNYEERENAHEDWIYDVAFSSNKKLIATVGADNTLKIWGRQKGTKYWEEKDKKDIAQWIYDVDFEPKVEKNKEKIAIATKNGKVEIWKWNGKQLVEDPKYKDKITHDKRVSSVSFSPEGKKLATASWDNTAKIWDSKNGNLSISLEEHTDSVLDVAFIPKSDLVATASADRTVKVWGLDGKLKQDLGKNNKIHVDKIHRIAFSPDGKKLATASWDNTVKLWTIDTNKTNTISNKDIIVLKGHKDRIYDVNFSSDGKVLATASWDKTVKVWDLKGNLLKTLEGHTDRVFSVSFSPEENMIASAGADKDVILWEFDKNWLPIIKDHKKDVRKVEFSPDGRIIGTAIQNETVKLWDKEKSKQIDTLANSASEKDKIEGIHRGASHFYIKQKYSNPFCN